ncbi:MAG: MGMT family protein [Clostridia bacterium]|nr:MGMT family protein [Clostridia bacterium]
MSFYQEIYDLVRQIPKGKVTTYGNIAKMLGRPRSSRVVGYALHVNPEPQTIPCHRVVNREGRLAPGFAFGGPDVQKQLLENEGVIVNSDNCVDLEKYLW